MVKCAKSSVKEVISESAVGKVGELLPCLVPARDGKFTCVTVNETKKPCANMECYCDICIVGVCISVRQQDEAVSGSKMKRGWRGDLNSWPA